MSIARFCPLIHLAAELAARNPRGIIFSGGPSSVYEVGAPHSDPDMYNLGVPILGICYGQQLMAHQLGGEVRPASEREYGDAETNRSTRRTAV